MKSRAHSAVVCGVRSRVCRNRGSSVASVSHATRSMSRIACRSTVISLTIVILWAASPANGFTLHRNQEKSETEADLVVAESTLVEVKHDLNRPNDIKAFERSRNEGLDKTLVTDSLRNKYSNDDLKLKLKNLEKGKNPPVETLETPEFTTDYSKGNIQFTTELKTTPSAATTVDNGEIYTGTTRESEFITTLRDRKITENGSPYTSTQITSVSIGNGANSHENNTLTTAAINNELNSVVPTVFNHFNLGAEVNTLQDSTSLDESGFAFDNTVNSNQTLFDEKKTESNEGVHSFSNATSSIIEMATNTPIDETRTTFNVGLTTTFAKELTKTINELNTLLDNTSAIVDLIPILNVTKVLTETSTTLEVNTKIEELETKDDLSITTTEPLLRKYTNIDRKHVTAPEVTTYADKEEITKAETTQTRISIEKALAVTPIASLERLREDLLTSRNKLVADQELSTTDKAVTSNIETSSTTPLFKKTDRKVGMVSSMRAGFLDYSGKSTSQERSTTESLKETFGKLYDSEAGEIEHLTRKYGSDIESQSQLAEDAIKEELLKEAMLNDNVAYAQRHRDDRAQTPGVEPSLTTDVKTALDSQTTQSDNKTATGDELSVQPISQEQGKNLDLYAVNPNYKPMKRIEVQPAKAFVRDPDDNSWRNESISSLGIVFKPKNSSKSFTQVLKNKTENVLSSLAERDSKNGVPDLRERLEKIAEVRKSKKKRINKFGDTVYSDYEESSGSGESFSTPKTETTLVSSTKTLSSPITTKTLTSTTDHRTTQSTATLETTEKAKEISKTSHTPMEQILKHNSTLTTRMPSKFYNIAEYYDTTDEYDADYLSLSKIDLKKFTVSFKANETVVTPPREILQTTPMPHYPPNRKPTIQYFPPRVIPKVNVHDYDEDFNRKVNQYTLKEVPKSPVVTTFRAVTSAHIHNEQQEFKEINSKPTPIPHINPIELNKKLYTPSMPHLVGKPQGFGMNNGDFNRASYVIKHYGDFINEAAKDDDDRNSDYVVLTEPPIRGITVDELAKLTPGKPATVDDYDYETLFRKDVLNRFVDNFNQNSERFKVDFPILYNNSVVHKNIHYNGNGLASSSAFMKRLYNDAVATKPNYLLFKKPCDPNCDKIAVELSPAYELHYYVPDQEEKEEADPRAATAHYRYRI